MQEFTSMEGGQFDQCRRLNGPGKIVMGKDTTYTGEVKNSVPHGKGTLITGSQTYECNSFKNGMPVGLTTMINEQGLKMSVMYAEDGTFTKVD